MVDAGCQPKAQTFVGKPNCLASGCDGVLSETGAMLRFCIMAATLGLASAEKFPPIAYSEWFRPPGSEEAPCARNATGAEYRLPPHYFADDDRLSRDGNVGRLPFTAEAQAHIYAHQNPSDCSRATLVHFPNHPYGFGSNVHVLTAGLGHALNNGLVVVFGGYGAHLAQGDYCAYPQPRSLECFFKPLSNCPIADPADVRAMPTATKENGERLDVFTANLTSLGFTSDDIKHWWRAQAALYIMRLNDRTARLLQQRRIALAEFQLLPLPLPAGTISIHIRHSDKRSEATLVPTTEYWKAALDLYSNLTSNKHATKSQTIFLSSEDAAVFGEELDNFTSSVHNQWAVYHIPGTKAQGNKGEPFSSSSALQSLLNLMVHLECSHFIGTLFSNWCRIINERRMVEEPGNVRPHGCCAPYVDVGPGHAKRDGDW